MKKIIMIIFTQAILFCTHSFAIDIISFHDKNFNHVGSGCGIHTEISGTKLVFMDVVPPKAVGTPGVCINYWKACNGGLEMFSCQEDGLCTSDIDQKKQIQLLESGNFAFDLGGFPTLFNRSSASTYQICPGPKTYPTSP